MGTSSRRSRPRNASIPSKAGNDRETAIRTTGLSDLYVALGDERGGGTMVLRAYVQSARAADLVRRCHHGARRIDEPVGTDPREDRATRSQRGAPPDEIALLWRCFCLRPPLMPRRRPETLADPALETRARALQKELRCLVCQGESLDESNAALSQRTCADSSVSVSRPATAIRQIEAYLVSRYGDFILMKPPFEPNTYLLWFGPAAVLFVGGGVAAMVVLRAHKRARAA